MFRNNFLRNLITKAAGFTLLETVVAMGLLSMAVGMIVPGVFQTLRFEQFWQDGVVATKDLRHAGSRFAGDALSTENTDLVDGVAADTVMLTNYAGHEATYSKNLQDELVRSHDDGVVTVENTLAAKVKTVEFLLSGDELTMTLVVYAVGTDEKSMTLRTTLR